MLSSAPFCSLLRFLLYRGENCSSEKLCILPSSLTAFTPRVSDSRVCALDQLAVLEFPLLTSLLRAVFPLAWSSPDVAADHKSSYYVWSNSFLLLKWKLLSQAMWTDVCLVVDPRSPALSGEWVGVWVPAPPYSAEGQWHPCWEEPEGGCCPIPFPGGGSPVTCSSHPLVPFFSFSFLFFFCFLGLHPWHMEVLRLGVESELQLPAHITAATMWIWAESETYTTDHSSIGSLTHWEPGIEPASSWMLVWFISAKPQRERP